MLLQIAVVIGFAANLLLLWGTRQARIARWLGLLLFFILPLLSVFPDQPRFQLDYHWFWVAGYGFITLAALLGGLTKWEYFRRGLLPMDVPAELIMTGPYQLVRHPLYLAGVFLFVGWWWVWAAVYGFYFGMFILALVWAQAYLEDKFELEPKFGQQFRDYKARTGMFWIK